MVNILLDGASPSRTYMLGIRHPSSPNEIRFEKVVLDEPIPNTIRSAEYNFLLNELEENLAYRIEFCISIEKYLDAAK